MPIYKANGKKDGLQKYNVRVNYISDSGQAKQLTRTAYGLEAAKELERRLASGVKDGSENTAKKMTVQQLFDEYEAAKQYEIRETTHDKNRRNYALYVKPTLAGIRIDRVTVALLQEWKRSIEQKGLHLNTKRHAYGIVRAILNYAVRMEYIPNSPLPKVGNFKEALSVKPGMSIYTAQEFMEFINAAKEQATEREKKHRDLSEWDYYVFFNIAFYCGLRKGEIHALKWSDLNGAYLSVKRSISQKLKGEDRETPPKNKSSIRTLQMPLPLIQILKEHRARQERLAHFTEDYRICGGERCLRDSTIETRNKQYAALSDLDSIRIHDFRHSHVSVLANSGILIQEVARRLGHSRVEMTWNTYSHLYPREEEKAVDVLNAIA
ncbi:MAG: site-specific integrase [Oscillospiraceae bacterium]|nr:site-specific integrase [Oscillospiraceae bacterium]